MIQARSTSFNQLPSWQLYETALPWSASAEEDARFNRLLKRGLIVFFVLSIAAALIPVPELSREEAERLPPQLAKLILEKKELPKPIEPVVKPEAKKEEKKPEPKEEIKKAPEPKPVVKETPPPATVELARQKAANSGLMQLQDELLDMRESLSVAEVNSGELAREVASAQQLDRSLISDRSKTASGGVNTGGLSRDTGGSALAARETTRVENAQASSAAKEFSNKTQRQKSLRGEESIRSIMEANKGAIFAIYNRALRSDPTLQGKLTVQLVIESNGAVSAIRLINSELQDADLERKLLARIRLINFGAANVDKATLNYSIDFLPS